MKFCSPAVVLVGLAVPVALSGQGDHQAHAIHVRAVEAKSSPRLGTISFPNSGASAAQPAFIRGVALLHSFAYGEAASAFQQAERADSGFALAYWLEALTHSPLLWGIDDPPGARQVLARFGPTPEARLMAAHTPRERAYGAAVEAFYADSDVVARTRAFAESLTAIAARDPADLEAATFASLALLMHMDTRTLSPAQRASEEARAIALADRVFRANPKHPGAAHYLIHVTDIDPSFAQRALPAARAYAKIAPDAEHALHMPSHVFLKLGLWDDQASSNERAWAASLAEVKRRGLPSSDLDFHDLFWLQYAYLQQGRWRAARALLDTARRLVANADSGAKVDAHYIVPMLQFAYAAETGRWEEGPRGPGAMALVGPRSSADRERSFIRRTNFQRAAAAIMRGDSVSVIDGSADSVARGSTALNVLLPALELDALAARRRGDGARAIEVLRRAAALEDSMPPVGPPALLRAHELLGALLLETAQPKGAAGEYERALALTPNRSAALLGLARARLGSGNAAGAADAYRRLLRNWHDADSDLPALIEARRGAVSGR